MFHAGRQGALLAPEILKSCTEKNQLRLALLERGSEASRLIQDCDCAAAAEGGGGRGITGGICTSVTILGSEVALSLPTFMHGAPKYRSDRPLGCPLRMMLGSWSQASWRPQVQHSLSKTSTTCILPCLASESREAARGISRSLPQLSQLH